MRFLGRVKRAAATNVAYVDTHGKGRSPFPKKSQVVTTSPVDISSDSSSERSASDSEVKTNLLTGEDQGAGDVYSSAADSEAESSGLEDQGRSNCKSASSSYTAEEQEAWEDALGCNSGSEAESAGRGAVQANCSSADRRVPADARTSSEFSSCSSSRASSSSERCSTSRPSKTFL